MLLAWSAIALGAGPSAMVAPGESRMELEVRQMVASQDGSLVVACTADQVVPLAGGPEIELDPGGIVAADISQEGWMALAHAGGVTVHDNTGRELLRLGGYAELSDLAISPNGLLFAVASSDQVALHQSADGRKLWSRKGGARSVTFHPDGKRVIAGIDTGNLVLKVANGRVAGGFDTEPAVWFQWTPNVLWTRETEGQPKAWDPNTLKPIEGVQVQGSYVATAVHPTEGWIVADGCVLGSTLCVASGVIDTAFTSDGTLWVAAEGEVREWQPLGDARVTDLGLPEGAGRITDLAHAGTDWLVVTEDGVLQRLAADGTPKLDVRVPGCDGGAICRPIAIGGSLDGAWAVGPDGQAAAWKGTGKPALRPKGARAVDAGRLPDGRWVILGKDGRVRVGTKPGKGAKTAVIEGARDLAVGREGFVVVGDGVHPYSSDVSPRGTPKLGPGRTARTVSVDSTGLAFAVIDDVGSLHRFSADGRPVFRATLGLPPEVDEVAWSADGTRLYLGGSPLKVLDASDGSLVMDVVLSPRGMAHTIAATEQGLLGVVQGGADEEEARLISLPRPVPEE